MSKVFNTEQKYDDNIAEFEAELEAQLEEPDYTTEFDYASEQLCNPTWQEPSVNALVPACSDPILAEVGWIDDGWPAYTRSPVYVEVHFPSDFAGKADELACPEKFNPEDDDIPF